MYHNLLFFLLRFMYIPAIIITSIVITIIDITPVQLSVAIRTCEPLVDMNMELVEVTDEVNTDELIATVPLSTETKEK